MKLLRDTWIIFTYELRKALRNPIWSVIMLLEPLCNLFLFAPLLASISQVAGFPAGGFYNVFVPGLLIMLAFAGKLYTGMNLIGELQSGVIERLRVTPANRLALLLGRVAVEGLVLLFQAMLLLVASVPLGLKAHLPGIVLALLLVVLLGIGMVACSYALALYLKDNMASVISLFMLPLLLLAGLMVPMSLGPEILQIISRFNPLTYAVDASRALFIGDLGSPAVWQGFVITLVVTVLASLWARRAFSSAMS